MAKSSAITLRVPMHIKKALTARAGKSRRSLSAEALTIIESNLSGEATAAPGRFLGIFAGSRLPSDADIRAAREDLWSGLGQRKP
jgi:transcriptional regulator of met regulon